MKEVSSNKKIGNKKIINKSRDKFIRSVVKPALFYEADMISGKKTFYQTKLCTSLF